MPVVINGTTGVNTPGIDSSGNPVLSGGVANGVTYLNGSKVLTSGSALTFDGTNFATTGSGTLKNLLLSAGTLPGAGNPSISLRSSDNVIYHQSGSANTIVMLDSAQNTMQSIGATAQIWNISNAEQMRLTSTGLGIGTSSPSAKLHVTGSAAGAYGAVIYNTSATGEGLTIRGGSTSSHNALIVQDYNGSNSLLAVQAGGNVGIGTSSPGYKLDVAGTARVYSNSNGQITISPVTNTAAASLFVSNAGGSAYFGKNNNTGGAFTGTAYSTVVYSGGSVPMGFYTNDALQMTLDTSGNLGIGTSSPATKLDVTGTIHSTAGLVLGSATDGTTGGFSRSGGDTYLDYAGTLRVRSAAASERVTLDASGNLGLGVTPSAWLAGSQAIQNSSGAIWQYGGGNVYIGQNYYLNSSVQRIYLTTAAATEYNQAGGAHRWYTAPSGTAGNAITFTQAMTLDASGNLGVGTTSAGSNGAGWHSVDVRGTTGGELRFGVDGGANFALYASASAAVLTSTSSIPIIFGNSNTERARITSGGDLLVAKTDADDSTQGFRYGGGTSPYLSVVRDGNPPVYLNRLSSDGRIMEFARSGTIVGNISITTTATAYNTSSDYRLKDIAGSLTGSGEFIDALKPKVGTWKADGSKFVGFLAHEVQEVSPQSVVGEKDAVDEEGKPIMQAMEYGSAEFIANIIAELQSVRKRLAALEGAQA